MYNEDNIHKLCSSRGPNVRDCSGTDVHGVLET